MGNFVSDKRLYLNADRSKVVEEGPDAAYLLVGEGGMVSAEDAEKYGLRLKEPKEASPVEENQEQLKLAEERGATEEARVLRQNAEHLRAEEKAQRESQSKARSAPPENKGG